LITLELSSIPVPDILPGEEAASASLVGYGELYKVFPAIASPSIAGFRCTGRLNAAALIVRVPALTFNGGVAPRGLGGVDVLMERGGRSELVKEDVVDASGRGIAGRILSPLS